MSPDIDQHHWNVTPYFIHIDMAPDDRGMGIRDEWIIIPHNFSNPMQISCSWEVKFNMMIDLHKRIIFSHKILIEIQYSFRLQQLRRKNVQKLNTERKPPSQEPDYLKKHN